MRPTLKRAFLSAAVPALTLGLAPLALSGPALADGAAMPSNMEPMGNMGAMDAMGHGDADEHGDTFAFGMPGHAGDVGRTVHIDMMDNVYSIKSMDVRPGETVRFILANGDDFTHEFVLGTTEMMAEHRQEMMEMMDRGMDMDTMMHGDPNAVTVPGGQTREFVWTFGQPGHYEFACNIPGHYEAGMHGDIDIQ